jgi:MFS family permease
MRLRSLLSILFAFLFIFNLNCISAIENDKICAVYFSSVNCANCAVTDPKVLGQWPGIYDNFIVIDYGFENWGEPNALLLGKYAEKFDSFAGTPNMFIGNKNFVGRIGILDAEGYIKQINSSDCLLFDKNVKFESISISGLYKDNINPKIWANNRVLIKTKDSANSDVSDDFLKQLLFSENIDSILKNSSYKIEEINSVPVQISDGEINFKQAIIIQDSWLLELNDNISVDLPFNSTNNSTQIKIPIFGVIDTERGSLILTTILIAAADGFNPCAFFILTFLLAAMLYAGSEEENKGKKRKRIILVGGIFVLFSALIYFLFMSLWLNVFLYAKQIVVLTLVAGIIAVFAGIINIKDYFFFQKGLSFTLSKKERFKFINKVEKLTQIKSVYMLILGTVIIAVSVNMYELLCTFGFPMVFLRILTLRSLTGFSYYSYVSLYSIVYVLPLVIIVSIFAYTLGKKEFGKDSIRRFKLISGFMVLFLGLILIINPLLLESIAASFTILAVAILLSLIIIGFKEGLVDAFAVRLKKMKIERHEKRLSKSEKEVEKQVEKLVEES